MRAGAEVANTGPVAGTDDVVDDGGFSTIAESQAGAVANRQVRAQGLTAKEVRGLLQTGDPRRPRRIHRQGRLHLAPLVADPRVRRRRIPRPAPLGDRRRHPGTDRGPRPPRRAGRPLRPALFQGPPPRSPGRDSAPATRRPLAGPDATTRSPGRLRIGR